MRAFTGEHYEIEYRDLSATISSVGATLRSLTCAGIPVIWSQPIDTLPVGGSGQVLAPWPNRLKDGTYAFEGIAAKAALNEPELRNAIHGLVRWLDWKLEYQERTRVKLSCTMAPQPAYPFLISLALLYEFGPAGLTVRTQAESRGARAPFGIGFHPYFLAGPEGLSRGRLSVPASRHLSVDGRGLPTGEVPIEPRLDALASPEGLEIGDLVLDDCFTGLVRDESGIANIRFNPGPGPIAAVDLRLDRHFDYVMCFTGDTLAEKDRRRAVAIEPMTCPPNAFVSGESVVALHGPVTFNGAYSVAVTLAD
jgi:aldose 1-epimerase